MTVARIPPMILAGCINHMMNIRDTWLTDCLWYWSCIEFRFRSRRLHKAQKSNGARHFHQRSRDQSEPLPAKLKHRATWKNTSFTSSPCPHLSLSLQPPSFLSVCSPFCIYLLSLSPAFLTPPLIRDQWRPLHRVSLPAWHLGIQTWPSPVP